MSGRDDLNQRPDAALAAALRALPETTPEPDLWPDIRTGIARTLDARRRPRRRYALPVAIAAAAALAVLVPEFVTRERATMPAPIASNVAPAPATNANIAKASATAASPANADSTKTDSTTELAQLHERSTTLERWIAAVAARAPQDGRDLMAAVEVEDLIGLVDVQLGGANEDADALPLWRQRVALLEDLAAIRGNAFALAESGVSADAAPATYSPMN